MQLCDYRPAVWTTSPRCQLGPDAAKECCQYVKWLYIAIMMTSSNGNVFRVTGPLCGEFTGHRWIPIIKASDAELWCFFICARRNSWINNREAGDLRRHRVHYDVTVMISEYSECGYVFRLRYYIKLQSYTLQLDFFLVNNWIISDVTYYVKVAFQFMYTQRNYFGYFELNVNDIYSKYMETVYLA